MGLILGRIEMSIHLELKCDKYQNNEVGKLELKTLNQNKLQNDIFNISMGQSITHEFMNDLCKYISVASK